MQILLMGDATGGGGGGTANARISLVIDSPKQEKFDGIDAASAALKSLQANLDAVNTQMQSLGGLKIPNVSEQVDKQTSKVAKSIGEITKSAKEAEKSFANGVGKTISSSVTSEGVTTQIKQLDRWAKSSIKIINGGESWTKFSRTQATAVEKVNEAINRSSIATKDKLAWSVGLASETEKLREQSDAWRQLAKDIRTAVSQNKSDLSGPQVARFRNKAASADMTAEKLRAKSMEASQKSATNAEADRVSKIKQSTQDQINESSARLKSEQAALKRNQSVELSNFKGTKSQQLALEEVHLKQQESLLVNHHRRLNRYWRKFQSDLPSEDDSFARDAVWDAKLAASPNFVRQQQKRKQSEEALRKENESAALRAKTDAEKNAKLLIKDEERLTQQARERATQAIPAGATPHEIDVAKARIRQQFHADQAATFGRAAAVPGLDPSKQSAYLAKQAEHQANAAAATHTHALAVNKLNQAYSHIGRNMLQNIAHVTAWTASVGVLYGSLRLLKESVGSVIDMQYQQARLSAVLGGNTSDAAELSDEVLRLAAANGRSGAEAMQAAVQWARLGLTKRQVAEAVKVSLVAANVAEITAAEATEKLSAIMVNYRLNANQLNGVMGMLNNTSNKYNVTVAGLFDGLQRVSSVAQQAGLSLAETQAILGATVGATGQTGANIGNSMKSFIGAITSEDTQKSLRSKFGIETTSGGALKDITQIINEMYVAYQNMTKAERQSMIFSTVGKNQASRITAVLDNYVKSQVLAVNSLMNLNSASAENAIILGTMKSQLQGVITEWTRFVSLQSGNLSKGLSFGTQLHSMAAEADSGAKQPPKNTLTESVKMLHNLGKIANLPVVNVVMTAMIGLTGALAARMIYLGVTQGMTAQKGGVMVESIKAVRASLSYLSQQLQASANSAHTFGAAITSSTQNLSRFAAAGRAAQGAFNVLGGLGGIGKAVTGFLALGFVLSLVNKLIDGASSYFGHNTDAVIENGDAMEALSERHNRAAEAFSIAARLFQSGSDAIGNAMTDASKKGAIDNFMGGIAGIDQQIEGASERLRAARGDVQQFNETLAQLKSEALVKQFIEEEAALKKMNERLADYERQLKKITDERPTFMSNEDVEKEKDKLLAAIGKVNESKFKLVNAERNRMKQDAEDFFKSSVTGLAFLEKEKLVLGDIAELYKEIGKNADRSVQNDLEIQKLGVIVGYNQQLAQALKARKEQLYKDNPLAEPDVFSAERRELLTGYNARIAEKTKQIAETETDSYERRHTRAEVMARRAELNKEKAAIATELQSKMVALGDQGNRGKVMEEIKRINDAISKVNESSTKAQSELVSRVEMRPQMRETDRALFRIRATTEPESARIEAHSYGMDEFEKFSNRRKYLSDELKKHEENRNRSSEDYLRAQTQANALLNNEITAKTKLEELEGKKKQHAIDTTKEYRKQLMLMGPGELLRDLALRKLGPGMSMGQFMGMAPDARKALMTQTGNDDQARELQNAIEKFRSFTSGKAAGGIANDMIDRVESISKIMDGLDPDIKRLLIGAPTNAVSGLAGRRERGGKVKKGQPYLVGEKGPEIVVPEEGGTVIPNDKIGMAGRIAAASATGMGAASLWSAMKGTFGSSIKPSSTAFEPFFPLRNHPAFKKLHAESAARALSGRHLANQAMRASGGLASISAGLISSGMIDAAESMRDNTNEMLFAQHRISASGVGRTESGDSMVAKTGGLMENNWSTGNGQSVSDWAANQTESAPSEAPRGYRYQGENPLTRYSRPYRPSGTPANRSGARPVTASRGVQPRQTSPRQSIPVSGPGLPQPSAQVDGRGAGGGVFSGLMQAANACATQIATLGGAAAAAAANVGSFSQAIAKAIADMAPKTAFSGPPMNADNPFA